METAITQVVEKERPWLRFWARTFDVLIHATIIGMVWVFLHEASIERMSSFSFNALTTFLWIFMEWGYMAIFGTTPGKKILGIRVLSSEGSAVPKYTALKRAILVWFRGMGVGVGLINLACYMIGYDNLRYAKITSWDRDLNLKVTYKKIGIFRMLICPMIIVLFNSIALINYIDL
ncbi:RDD family protein [Paenibacillus paeoniae]|uniref:RDD family protein n=1 Tax=Paenibacillus paeoniae TaxID=2292705 RepID=UPI0014020DBC|nr:RDD family protein [Paenibacillus paeoniae]